MLGGTKIGKLYICRISSFSPILGLISLAALPMPQWAPSENAPSADRRNVPYQKKRRLIIVMQIDVFQLCSPLLMLI